MPQACSAASQLTRQGREISSLDLFGRAWVLLIGADARAWEQGAVAIARELPLELHRVDGRTLRDPSGTFHSAYDITPSGAVLVRPDGVVAWRERTSDAASPERLTGVLLRLLGRVNAA